MTLCRLTAMVVSVVLGLSLAGAAGAAPHCPPTNSTVGKLAVSVTNAMRHAQGLPAVSLHPALNRAAAAHACEMARQGRLTHRGSMSSGPANRVKQAGYAPSRTAENIAAGPFSLRGVLQAWQQSRGHRKNVMMRQAQHFGLGQAVGADGKTIYWAAVYAAPR